MFNQIEKKISLHLVSLAFLLCFLLNFLLHFPGKMTNDSNNQLAEAISHQFTDLHPPVMAVLWSWLIPFSTPEPALLLFHLLFHWLGLYFIAAGLLKINKKWLAIFVLLAGCFPTLIFHNAYLHKDVGMASTFIAAFGAIFYFRIQEKSVPIAVYLFSFLLLAYGFLVRANGIFALGALLIYFCGCDAWQKTMPRAVIVAMIVSILALPLTQVINKHILGARSLENTYALFLFDIAGIAETAHDLEVIPSNVTLSASELAACYSPYWWDPFSPWGSCKGSTQNLGNEYTKSAAALDKRRALKSDWVKAIKKHPFAYMTHRIKVLNSELYFMVPAFHCRYAPGCGADVNVLQATKIDYIKNNFFFWPVFWLTIGILLCRRPSHSQAGSQATQAARALALSGVFYLGSLLIIGVATASRYAYWPQLAILLSLILSYESIKTQMNAGKRFWLQTLLPLWIVILAGLAARIANFTYLVT